MYGYTDLGEVLRVWGHRAYPVEYGYDSYGDLTTMKTYQSDAGSTWTASAWPASPPTAYTTTWVRDAGTGLVTAKTDAAGKSTQWTYLPNGRVAARQWAEKKDLGGGTLKERVTKYAYGDTGALSGVDYVWGLGGAEQNDTDTPDIGHLPARLVTGVTDGTGTRAFTYTSLAVLEWETLPALFKSSASTNRRVVIQRQGSGSGLLPGRYAGAQVVAGGLSGEHALVVSATVQNWIFRRNKTRQAFRMVFRG